MKILVVCLGNICRSPAAEAILAHLFEKEGSHNVVVDSCGLGEWHAGRPADMRMQEAARKRGYQLSKRARMLSEEDFDDFDLIFAVDQMVLDELHERAKGIEQKGKIHLLTEYSSCFQGQPVPDPYQGKFFEFEHVLDILEESCRGILERYK